MIFMGVLLLLYFLKYIIKPFSINAFLYKVVNIYYNVYIGKNILYLRGICFMKNLVCTKWVKERLGNTDAVIFDCRFSLMDPEYGEKAYKKEHIEGAIKINLDKDLASKVEKHGGRHPLPKVEEFKSFMEDLGVSNNSTVIVYDDGDLAGASRLWWMLKYIGIENVHVMEGGIKKWILENNPTTDEISNINNKGSITVKLNEDLICDVNYVKERMKDKNTIIIDSRARERYLGKVEPMDKKAGHIPGSKNYDWANNFKDGKLISKNDLKERFKGVEDYKDIIVHCGSGITGCVNVLMLKEINIDSKLYAGSWSDWCSYEENPVSTEEE